MAPNRLWRGTCLVMAWLVIGLGLGFAQAGTPVDIRNYYYTVVAPNVVLQAGESVDVQVIVGKPNSVVRGVVGFNIVFELSPLAAKLTTLNPGMGNSWLQQQGSWVQEVRSGTQGHIYSYTYGRSAKVDGCGEVLRLRLESAQNGVNAADLLQASSGVLVVENLDIRLSADAQDGFALWPNPGNGSFHLRMDGAAPANVKVMDLQGKLLQSFGEVGEIDLSDLPQGTYLVQATDSDQVVHHRRLGKL